MKNIFELIKKPLILFFYSGIEKPCSIQGYLANGYTSVCIQKYTMKSLVIYIPKEKTIEIQKFEVPSCCTCNLRHKFDPAM